jgi:DNA-binding transcriptional MerR regulator
MLSGSDPSRPTTPRRFEAGPAVAVGERGRKGVRGTKSLSEASEHGERAAGAERGGGARRARAEGGPGDEVPRLRMELKNTYSAREVAARTGLSARQLQWWDARRLFAPAVAPKRTPAGGFTERRYTPVDLLELMVLADLRRQGLSVARLRQLLQTLRNVFGIRLFDAVGGTGPLTMLTDGRDLYARTSSGQFYNLLRAPAQPLLVVGMEPALREVTAKAKRKGKGKREKGKRRQPIGKTLSKPSAGRGIT